MSATRTSHVAAAQKEGTATPTAAPSHTTGAVQVLPGLWLGSAADEAQPLAALRQMGLTHVLQVACEVTPTHVPGEPLAYLRLPLEDLDHEDLLSALPAAFGFLDSALAQGGAVLVHCLMGVSRSASVVMAYMMRQQQGSFLPTLTRLRALRKVVNPNLGFRLQLQLFQEHGWAVHPSWWRGWDLAQFVAERARRAAVEDGALLLLLGGNVRGAAKTEAPLLMTDSAPSSPAAAAPRSKSTTDIWDPRAWVSHEDDEGEDSLLPVPAWEGSVAALDSAGVAQQHQDGAQPEELTHVLLQLEQQHTAAALLALPRLPQPAPALATQQLGVGAPGLPTYTAARRHSQPGAASSRMAPSRVAYHHAPPTTTHTQTPSHPDGASHVEVLPLAVTLSGPVPPPPYFHPLPPSNPSSQHQAPVEAPQPVDVVHLAHELLQVAAAPLPGDASLGAGSGSSGGNSGRGSESGHAALQAPVPLPLSSSSAAGRPVPLIRHLSAGGANRRRRFQAPPGDGSSTQASEGLEGEGEGELQPSLRAPPVDAMVASPLRGGAALGSSGSSAWQSRGKSRDGQVMSVPHQQQGPGPGTSSAGSTAPATPQSAWNGRPALHQHQHHHSPSTSTLPPARSHLLPPLHASPAHSPRTATAPHGPAAPPAPPSGLSLVLQGRSNSHTGTLATHTTLPLPPPPPPGGSQGEDGTTTKVGQPTVRTGASSPSSSPSLPAPGAPCVRAWPTLQLPGSPHSDSGAPSTNSLQGSRTPSSPGGGDMAATGRSPRRGGRASGGGGRGDVSDGASSVTSPSSQVHVAPGQRRASSVSGDGTGSSTPLTSALRPPPAPLHIGLAGRMEPSTASSSSSREAPAPSGGRSHVDVPPPQAASASPRPAAPGQHSASPRVPPLPRPSAGGGSSKHSLVAVPAHLSSRSKPSLTLPTCGLASVSTSSPGSGSGYSPMRSALTQREQREQSPVLSPAPGSPRLPTQGSGALLLAGNRSPRAGAAPGSAGDQLRDPGELSRFSRSSDLLLLPGSAAPARPAAHQAPQQPHPAVVSVGCSPCHRSWSVDALQPLCAQPSPPNAPPPLGTATSSGVSTPQRSVLVMQSPRVAVELSPGSQQATPPNSALHLAAPPPPQLICPTAPPTSGSASGGASTLVTGLPLPGAPPAGGEAQWGRTDSVAATTGDDDLVERLMDMALTSLPPAMLLEATATHPTRTAPRGDASVSVGKPPGGGPPDPHLGSVDGRRTPLPPWPHYLVLQPISTPSALQSDLTSGL